MSSSSLSLGPCSHLLASQGSSSSSSAQAPYTVQTALEFCIARINSMVQKIELGIQNERLSKLNCSITIGCLEDPVVANCGHVFSRTSFQASKDQGDGSCKQCKTPLTQFNPILGLREFVQDLLPNDSVPTRSRFTGLNQDRVDLYLQLIQGFLAEENYSEVLKLYGEVLRYTNSSEIYANIPQLYKDLGELEKATLSRLHLSIYQLQEGKIQDALNTLKCCESQSLKFDSLEVGLNLRLCSSPENIAWGLNVALEQENPNDKMFIYRQIIVHAPDSLEAYEKIIPFINDPVEKRELLLKAADLAHQVHRFDLEEAFRFESKSPRAPTVISTNDWANAQAVNLPPYSQELQDFLAGDCKLWPEKKRSETHFVVPLFSEVAIDGAFPTELTLETLDQLDKSARGPGCGAIWDRIPKNISVGKGFRYAVMTREVIPGSRNKSYNDQLKLLPEGYKSPPILGLTFAVLWEKRLSGNWYFSDNLHTYTSCQEIVGDWHLLVGGSVSAGLRAYVGSCVNEGIGVVGWREFHNP